MGRHLFAVHQERYRRIYIAALILLLESVFWQSLCATVSMNAVIGPTNGHAVEGNGRAVLSPQGMLANYACFHFTTTASNTTRAR